MNDGHKGMTCEREKVRAGEEEGIFCVTLQLAVSSKAPSMKIALLSGTFFIQRRSNSQSCFSDLTSKQGEGNLETNQDLAAEARPSMFRTEKIIFVFIR